MACEGTDWAEVANLVTPGVVIIALFALIAFIFWLLAKDDS